MTTTLLDQLARLPILPHSLALWSLGQMGLIIKGPDGTIVIDPCLSDAVRQSAGDWWARAYDPPVDPAALTDVRAVLITHSHGDHLDPQTLAPLAQASPDAVFVAPGWCRAKLGDAGIGPARIIEPTALTPFTLPGLGARVTATPSAHYAKEFDAALGYRWLGYHLAWNGVTLYHAGDTVLYDGYVEMLRGVGSADIAVLPINGRDWLREQLHDVTGNLLPAEAAWLSTRLGWDVVIAGHNDLYPNNTIPMADIVAAFAAAAPRQKLHILQPGELYYYAR